MERERGHFYEAVAMATSAMGLAGAIGIGMLWLHNHAAVTGVAGVQASARDNAVTELNTSSPPALDRGASERIAGWRNDGYAIDVSIEQTDAGQFIDMPAGAYCVTINENVTHIPAITSWGVPTNIVNQPQIVGYACQRPNQNFALVAVPMTVALLVR